MADVIYGKIQGLPDEVEPAVRVAKYSIFELRWQKRTVNDITFSGPFSFTAKENEDNGDVRVKWNNQRDRAIVRFLADDSGLAICWMPDDKYWHNRLYLMDQPHNFPLVNYHTPTGTYPASYIKVEIDCLKKALKTMVPIYQVLRNGSDARMDFFHTEAEAKKYIERQAKAITKFTKEGVVNESAYDADYTIERRQREEYRPEMTELAKRNHRLPWGWTSCPEFMNEIKPRVMAEIERIRKASPVQDQSITKQAFMNMVRGLTPEEKNELLGVAGTTEPKQDIQIPEVTIPEDNRPEDNSEEEVFSKETTDAVQTGLDDAAAGRVKPLDESLLAPEEEPKKVSRGRPKKKVKE